AILMLGLLCLRPASAVTYSVGTQGGNCTHGSLQDAVNDVPTGSTGNFIRVESSAVLHQLALTIDNRNITIVGGFADCGDANPQPHFGSVLDGANNGGNSVVHISGASDIVLENFYIQRGTQGDDSHGGGINYVGHGSLALYATSITSNRCGYGGGLNV